MSGVAEGNTRRKSPTKLRVGVSRTFGDEESMSTEPLLIVQHQSPLRTVSDTESLDILTADKQSQPRRVFTLYTPPYQHDVEGGHWRSSHGYLRQVADEIRS